MHIDIRIVCIYSIHIHYVCQYNSADRKYKFFTSYLWSTLTNAMLLVAQGRCSRLSWSE